MVINTLSLNFHNANKGFGSWGQNLKAKSKFSILEKYVKLIFIAILKTSFKS